MPIPLGESFTGDVAQGVQDTIGRGVLANVIGLPVDLYQTVAGRPSTISQPEHKWDVKTHRFVPIGEDKPAEHPFHTEMLDKEKPVMGSEFVGDYLEAKGQVSPNRNPVAETLAGFVDPITAPAALAKGGAAALKAAPHTAMFLGLAKGDVAPQALQQAKKFTASRVAPEVTWHQTGWGKDPLGNWITEVSDDKAVLDKKKLQSFITPGKLSDVLTHDELYKASPSFKNIKIQYRPEQSHSSYDAGNDLITIGMDTMHARDPVNTLRSVLHETQHAAQSRYELPRGGASNMAFRDTKAFMKGDKPSDAKPIEKITNRIFADKIKSLASSDDPTRLLTLDEYVKKTNPDASMVTTDIKDRYHKYKTWYHTNRIDAQNEAATEWYERLHGETQARITGSPERQDKTTEERRKLFPLGRDYHKMVTGFFPEDTIFRGDSISPLRGKP